MRRVLLIGHDPNETFGVAPATFEAAADVIFGTLTPTAKLPVTVAPDMPRGWPGVGVRS